MLHVDRVLSLELRHPHPLFEYTMLSGIFIPLSEYTLHWYIPYLEYSCIDGNFHFLLI